MFIKSIPYKKDSAELFSPIANMPWAVFIDSCGPDTKNARFDIIAAEPTITLLTIENETTITTSEKTVISTQDPFFLLQHHLKKNIPESLSPQILNSNLPFHGGAIGYFSYDLARRLEKLPNHAKQNFEFPMMNFGIYDEVIVVDHQTQSTFFISNKCISNKKDQDSTQTENNKFPDWVRLVLKKTSSKSKTESISRSPFQLLHPFRSNMNREDYSDAFDCIMNYIEEGECYQINLAQRFSSTFLGSPWDAYQLMRKKNPAPYSAYLNFSTVTILSSSPERFIQCKNRGVESKPIKGTRPRHLNDSLLDQHSRDELLQSEKDRAENVMIVDLIRNDLGKSCKIGSVKVPQLFNLESFSNVHHLVSTVTGELSDDKDPLDLLRGAFPGGSITGAPKIRAMEIIDELEPHRRNIYCGSIGYIGFNGEMDTNIAIRTVYTDNHRNGENEKNEKKVPKRIYCSGGGGLVADSKMETEYKESIDKVKIILETLEKTISR